MAKAVMVLAVITMYFLAGGLGRADPALGIEIDRVELFGELLILGHRNFRAVS